MMRKDQTTKNDRFAVDYVLLIPALMLTCIGVIMVYSASSETALRSYQNEYYFFHRHLVFALAGLGAMLLCRYIPFRVYRWVPYGLLLTAMGLLAAVFFQGMGHTAGGATRWLSIGGFRFQPVEVARFALIVFMAYSLAKKQDQIEVVSIGFAPHVMVLLMVTGLLILQPDFGSTVIFWMLAWMIMFAGRVRVIHLGSAVLPLLPAALLLIIVAPYRLDRVRILFNPWSDPLDKGYQIVHSLMAFGSGGLFGKGFGQGYQKLFYLPAAHTDFIFSIIGEEGGLFWIFVILALFLVILWRGILIARAQRECFAALLALGLTVSIALQAVLNMGVTLSLLPTKGLTLPFLSYGGTSLIMNLAFIGILMNIWASGRK
jgi:cell division protein FtsW